MYVRKFQSGADAKSYLGKYLRISSYIRKPFFIYDLYFLYMRKIFISVCPVSYSLQRNNTEPRNKYSQKRNCADSVPMSTFMCFWEIYIVPRSVGIFCNRKICGLILGIYKIGNECTHWANLQVLSYATHSKLRCTLLEFFADFLHK